MEKVGSYLKTRSERRKALIKGLRAIEDSQPFISQSETALLKETLFDVYVKAEIVEMSHRYLGEEAIRSVLGLNQRSRR